MPSRASRWTPALAPLLVALLASGCAPRAGDVVLIAVDTLRYGHLGSYGYERETSPAIDAFFAEGALYERAYATSAHTPPSLVSALTGLEPPAHRVRLFYQLLPGEVPLVSELLPPAFQTAAFVSSTVLTDEALGVAERFDHYDDFVDERESSRDVFERRAERTTEAALAWVATADPARPLFLFVHYIDPHGPYRPPDPFPTRFSHGGRRPLDEADVPPYQREAGVDDGLVYVDRYDGEIAYLDGAVGRLLEGLGALRDVDDALVILTADHGESMMEHESWFTHGYHVYEEIVRVPMMLRGPGVARGRFPGPASLLDVAPTVLAAVGATVPEAMAGVDLRRPSRVPPDRTHFVEGGMRAPLWFGAVAGVEKAMARVGLDREVLEHRRYDLASDPVEESPGLPDPLDPLAERLRRRVESDPDPGGVPRSARWGAVPGRKVAPGAPAGAEAGLRALGYLDPEGASR